MKFIHRVQFLLITHHYCRPQERVQSPSTRLSDDRHSIKRLYQNHIPIPSQPNRAHIQIVDRFCLATMDGAVQMAEGLQSKRETETSPHSTPIEAESIIAGSAIPTHSPVRMVRVS